MKSTELFDILGEIDDRFYEEARLPDEQHGVVVISEQNPFKAFMSLFLPIAACIAIAVAVAVGAKIINGRELVDSSVVDSLGAAMTNYNIADYPPLDLESVPYIKGNAVDTQGKYADKKLRSATIATIKCGEYDVSLLGDYIHIDGYADPNALWVYDLTLALSKDGELINTEGVYMSTYDRGYSIDLASVSSHLEYYELNGGELIMLKNLNYVNQTSFYTITGSGRLKVLVGDEDGISNHSLKYSVYLKDDYTVDTQSNVIYGDGMLYSFHCENFDLEPSTAAPAYIIGSPSIAYMFGSYDGRTPKFKDGENIASLRDIMLGKAEYGNYTVYLTCDELAFKADEPDLVYADTFMITLEQNGVRIGYDFINVSRYRLPKDKLAENCVNIYKMDGKPFIMITYPFIAEDGSCDGTPYNARFHTIEGSKLKQITGYGIGLNGEPMTNETTLLDQYTVSEDECCLTTSMYNKELRYEFSGSDFKYRFADPEMVIANILDGCSLYDKDSDEVQPFVCFDIEETLKYRFVLLGQNVKNEPAEDFPLVKYDRLFIAVEKDGEIVAEIDADNPDPLNAMRISDYLQRFNMSNGQGFVMYYSLDPYSQIYEYAMLYAIKDDKIVKLRYEYDYAPAPATGSPSYIGTDFYIMTDSNSLVGKYATVTINFTDNTYMVEYSGDIPEREVIDDIEHISDYRGYDPDTNNVQFDVVLDVKDTGNYKIALIAEDVTNRSYAGMDAVYCGNAALLIERAGAVVVREGLGDLYLDSAGLKNYIQPFTMKSGEGFLMYHNVETWANSLPTSMIYALNGDKLIPIGQEYIDPGYKIDLNSFIDANGVVTIDFSTYTTKRTYGDVSQQY